MKKYYVQKLLAFVVCCLIMIGYVLNANAQSSITGYVGDYGQYSRGAKKVDSCVPYHQYKAKEQCLLCPLFAIVFNTVSKVTAVSIAAFSNSVVRVVIVGFGIWLAIQILMFVSSIETRDIKDLLQNIITQGFLIILVVFILKTGAAQFFDTFINPVYETGQALASSMFDDCRDGESTLKCSEADKEVLQKKDNSTIASIPNGLPASMGSSIINTMTMMENRVRKIKALGSSLMCQSWKDAILFIIPHFGYLLTGLGIWLLSMVIIIGVPFLMIDAVLQLGVAGALLPFAVGGFAFKSTRQYSKKVWETFLNSMFAFLFISIVVLIILGAVQAIITESTNIFKTQHFSFDDLFISYEKSSLIAYDAVLQQFGWFSMPFLKLAFVFILAWSVMNMSKEFADEFAQSISSTSIGSSIGTMAASTAKGMAVKAGKPMASKLGKEALNTGNKLLKGGGRAIRRQKFNKQAEKLEKAKKSAQDSSQKINTSQEGKGDPKSSVTTNTENGQITQVEQSGNKTTSTTVLQDGSTSIVTMENGVKVSELRDKNGVITDIKYDKKGARVEVERSAHFTITRKYDKDGNLIDTKTKANSRRADYLLNNPKGEFSKADLDKMMEGMSEEQKAATFAAVGQQILNNRIKNNKKGKIVSEEVVYCDYEQGFMEIKKTTDKGEVIFEKVEIKGKVLKTTSTFVDEKGRVTQMSSDGIHNKIEKFRLGKDFSAEDIKDTEDISLKREQDADGKYKKSKVSYGYTAWYRDQLAHGLDPNEIGLGMFTAEEAKACYNYYTSEGNEFGKAEIGWSFN